MKVAVGSTNPAKIKAVKLAFETVWPNKKWHVTGVEVNSGVSNQPMSYEESMRGARNRATKAMEKSHADFAVGLEGGIQKIGEKYFDSGWIVIIDARGKEGIGSSAEAEVPPKMMERVKEGIELGFVDDEFFNLKNSKHGDGHFGLITNNSVTRTNGYRDGVIMALARFLHPELYE